MSVKRKSDAGEKSENVKQLKVPKPKKEKDLEIVLSLIAQHIIMIALVFTVYQRIQN